MEWGATYFSIRSNVTPGTNLALFCIQNLWDRKKRGGLVKVATSRETKRGSDNRKCSAFTLHILWATITRRNTSVTNESLREKKKKKNYNRWVVWRVVFGRHAVGDRKPSRISGRSVYRALAARLGCKSRQAGVESLGHNMPRLPPWNITPFEHWIWVGSAGTCCGG